MPLSEAEIQRYARHILLPEIGGAGQERLLAAEVRVRGEASAVELASDYLRAAGVSLDAHSGDGLEISILGASSVVARVDGEVIKVTSSSCTSCLGGPSGPLSNESGAIAACLAASEVLRTILGIGEIGRAWTVRGASVEATPVTCAHRGAS